jgi:hypothetical protein
MPVDVTIRPAGVAAQRFRASWGMTEWYLPTPLEYVETLPRNDTGRPQRSFSDVG